jgi:hypothetical protein
MLIQFEIPKEQEARILSSAEFHGFVYDPMNTATEEQQKWDFFITRTRAGWDSDLFNYERSLAIANEPNDTAAEQAKRYEAVENKIISDNEKPWTEGEALSIGMVRTEGDKVYVVTQDHVTEAGKEPSADPTMYVEKPSEKETLEWSPKTVYYMDDKVLYGKQTWICIAEKTMNEPSVSKDWIVFDGKVDGEIMPAEIVPVGK